MSESVPNHTSQEQENLLKDTSVGRDLTFAPVQIINYYYREEARLVPADSTDVADEYLPCPYRGLFHFGPNDADVFFGREIFIEEIYTATKTRNFIPVLGASGSGKSSVVLAGLVPKLQKAGNWKFTHFRPGAAPFYALAEALIPLYTPELDSTDQIVQTRKLAGYLYNSTISLADVFRKIQQNHPNHRVLLIADQFEEIYTLCNNPEIRRKFLDCLLGSLETPTSLSASATVWVTTMRADFLGNALSYRPFADVLQNADLKLGPMNREELTQVIEKPAQKLGVTFEIGLVKRILEDVENQPGNLPLLEFALTELWNKRRGKQLTHKIYEEIGQVEGALARHADEKYGNLTDDEKEKVRRIFIQLVRPGEGAEDTRRIAIKAELGEQSWSLVKQLADARLVVTSRNATSQETVEVVHEALIRNWGELREWMNTNRVFRAWQERLRAAKGQWEATNRDFGSLLRGAALAEAEEKLKERPEDLIDEQEFIEQSIQEGNRLKQVEAARRKREIRTAWGIAAGSLVAVMISGGLGLTAWNQNKQAELNQAKSLGQYSLSLLNENKDLEAFITAIKAGKILQNQNRTDSDVITALLQVFYGAIERNRWSDIEIISLNPNEKILALVSANDKSIIKLMSIDGKLLKSFSAESEITALSWSRDGKTLSSSVSVNDKAQIKLWSIDGQLIKTFSINVDSEYIWHTLSPDGNILATNGIEYPVTSISLWNKDGNLLTELSGRANIIYAGSWSPDGKILAVANKNTEIQLWSIDGNLLKTLPTARKLNTGSAGSGSGSILTLAWSPDGEVLAATGYDQIIQIWNRDGELIVDLPEQVSIVTSLSWSRINPYDSSEYQDSTKSDYRDSTLISGSNDGTISLWRYYFRTNIGNTRGGWKLFKTIKANSSVSTVDWTYDGKTLISLGKDKILHIWNMDGTVLPTTEQVVPHTDDDEKTLEPNNTILSPNGKMLASISDDSKTIEIKSTDGQLLHRSIPLKAVEDKVNIYSFAWSPDSKTLAFLQDEILINTTYLQLTLWEIEGKTLKRIPINSFSNFEQSNLEISWSPNSRTIYLDNGSQRLQFSLELKNLLVTGCNWIQDYLKTNPKISESDRHLCEGISTQK
ncbi:WD-40 repeat-containing protein [Calothrix brevissima NIES-22]|nr:WD-40 repeat-containing protein [Calothrix brevissima NIES-22]